METLFEAGLQACESLQRVASEVADATGVLEADHGTHAAQPGRCRRCARVTRRELDRSACRGPC